MNPQLKHVGLSLAQTPCVLRDVRLHDGSPAKHTHVLSSNGVGMTSAATRHTTERGLIGAIGLVCVSAGETAARGIPGIDQHHGNTGPPCFVADTGAELKERPTMQLSTLLPPSPHPRANAVQIFKAHRSLRAFGSLYNAFADRVIYVFGKTALFASKLFQAPPRRFGAALLEFRSPPLAIPHIVQHAAAVVRSVRVAGDVGDTQVNPKHVVNVLWIGFLHRARYQQIPVATVEQQIAFALPGVQHLPLAFAAHERDGLSPGKGPDRERRVGQRKREDAVIVGDTDKRSECALRARVPFVGITHFRQTTHGHLGRQAKLVTHIVVDQFLQRVLSKRARLPGHMTDVVACSICLLQGALQGGLLVRRREQFDVGDDFHILK